MKQLWLVLVFVLVSANVFAQVFPVQGTVQITPPYSPYLSDYIAPGSQKLFLQLLANDVNIVDHPISLRVTIEGIGITIRTKQNFIPSQPLTLYGAGAPTILYGDDIAEYFNPNNLDFSGYSRREFDRTGKLPEGVYRFTIEVFSFNRNVIISNKASTTAWIILNDPPILNLPRKDTKVRIIDPMNIAFTWTPRNTGSPNAAFTTEYTFRLVEVWPANRNPFDAFLSQVPLYEITTDQTQIVYGPAEPALIPGRLYAWQVQAKDSESRDVFKNEGRSEVYVFQFGDALSPPGNVIQDNANSSSINISWDAPLQGEIPAMYRVRYRKKGSTDRAWNESVTDQRWITLPDLLTSTSYEVQVRSEARPQFSEYSQQVSVQTTEVTPAAYSCGADIKIPLPGNVNPLPVLKKGDVITSRNFRVYVTEAQGSGGIFSGKGSMPVPFLNMATVNVEFSGIKVNSGYELLDGVIATTFNPGGAMGRVIEDAEKIGETPTVTVDTTAIKPLEIKIEGTIDSVYVDAGGEIVVVNADGTKTNHKQPVDSTTQAKKPVLITDSAGNGYMVQTDPATGQTKVTKVDPATAGGNTVVQADPVKDKIIVKVLEQFETEIAAWLRINGKGGEDDNDVLWAASLGDIFPESEDILTHVQEHTIPQFKVKPGTLRGFIESDSKGKELLTDIAKPFSSPEEVDLMKVDGDDKDELRKITARALIDIDEHIKYEKSIAGVDLDLAPQGENMKYILYFTPAGKLYALPDFAKPIFENSWPDVKVPPGALTGADINGVIYQAWYVLVNGQWRFDKYRTFDEKPRYGKELMSFMTEEAISETIRIASAEDDMKLAGSPVLGLALTPSMSQGMGVGSASLVVETGPVSVVGIQVVSKLGLAAFLWGILETFSVSSNAYYGVGPVVLELPIATMVSTTWRLPGGLPATLPITAPVAIPHKLPKGNGNCSVYVIFRISVTGQFEIAKYGMTCQTKPDGTQCDDRPESQCRYFNSQPGYPYYNLQYKYWWIWVPFATDIKPLTARIVEKSLTGAYILNSPTRSLPPMHERPCFKRAPDIGQGDDFNDYPELVEREKRVIGWLNEMIKKYGAK